MHLQSPRAIVSRHLANQPLPRCAAVAILSFFLLCSAESRASDTNQFFRLPIYATGGTPVKIVTADFNGDGNQDVVVLPSGGNFVRVFLGHGDGTFAAPVSISAGLTAGDMVVGDFNGDNKADIALASGTSVAVLLGKSGGTFQTAIVTKTGLSSATSLVLALGDVNRDSHLDIAANDTYGGIQVLIGTCTGHFNLKPVITFNQPPEPLPTGIAIADFTGDGRPDIAVGFITDYPLFYIGQACILPGYGDGTF